MFLTIKPINLDEVDILGNLRTAKFVEQQVFYYNSMHITDAYTVSNITKDQSV